MGIASYSGASSVIKPGVCTTATRPSSPFVGQAIYDTDVASQLIWNGTAWGSVSALTLVKAQTIGTAVSSVAVTDAFSATYDAYKIVISGGAGSTISTLGLTLGGSTTQYYGAFTGASSGASLTMTGMSNASSWNTTGTATTAFIMFDATLVNPFLAKVTVLGTQITYNGTGYGTTVGEHNSAVSYTGFTITCGTGTITGGTISVYGYAKA